MLFKAHDIKGFRLEGLDGEFGHVEEFFFDDQHWAVRYMVANTGNWLTGHQVLIAPQSIEKMDFDLRTISVRLSKKQIEESPLLEDHQPVSRQYEGLLYDYYGLPTYWSGPYMWGAYPHMWYDETTQEEPRDKIEHQNHHLRSTHDVRGHHLQASDGEFGHVDDFIIDEKTWAIRYLVVDTQNWWPGRKVLLAPQWISSISWIDAKVYIALNRSLIEHSPEYRSDMPITREQETALYAFYQRTPYWMVDSLSPTSLAQRTLLR